MNLEWHSCYGGVADYAPANQTEAWIKLPELRGNNTCARTSRRISRLPSLPVSACRGPLEPLFYTWIATSNQPDMGLTQWHRNPVYKLDLGLLSLFLQREIALYIPHPLHTMVQSPLLESFDPFATHPFTNIRGVMPEPPSPSAYLMPVPQTRDTTKHPRYPSTSTSASFNVCPVGHRSIRSPQPRRHPPQYSPTGMSPTSPTRQIFVPCRKPTSSPDLVLKKKAPSTQSDESFQRTKWRYHTHQFNYTPHSVVSLFLEVYCQAFIYSGWLCPGLQTLFTPHIRLHT